MFLNVLSMTAALSTGIQVLNYKKTFYRNHLYRAFVELTPHFLFYGRNNLYINSHIKCLLSGFNNIVNSITIRITCLKALEFGGHFGTIVGLRKGQNILFFLSAIFNLSITMTNTKLEFQGVWIHDKFDKITIYYTLRLQQYHGVNVFNLDFPLHFQSVIVGMMAKGGNSSFEFFLHSYNLTLT